MLVNFIDLNCGTSAPNSLLEPEHQHQRLLYARHVVVGERAEVFTEFGPGDGGNLVGHHFGLFSQSVGRCGLNMRPGIERRTAPGGEAAGDDRMGINQFVRLHDNHRARFAGVIGAARLGPDFTALHWVDQGPSGGPAGPQS